MGIGLALGIAGGTQLLQGALGGLFPGIFGGEAEFKGEDPRQYKDELTLSPGEASSALTGFRQSAGRQQAVDRAGVRASGAPLGAQLATLGGIAGRTTSTESALAGDFVKLQQQSYSNYLNQVNSYASQQYQADLGNAQSKSNLFGGVLGGLGSLATMYAGGMFGSGGGGGGKLSYEDVQKLING